MSPCVRPSRRLFGRSFGRSVRHNVPKRGGKFHLFFNELYEALSEIVKIIINHIFCFHFLNFLFFFFIFSYAANLQVIMSVSLICQLAVAERLSLLLVFF